MRLGAEGYNVRMKVTKSLPRVIDPEVDEFIKTTSFLSSSRIYRSVRRISTEDIDENENAPAKNKPDVDDDEVQFDEPNQ